MLDENKRKFLDGEKITAEMFLEITGRDGFDIHIRKYKGRRTPDFTGCHKAVADYLAFLAGNEIRK